VTEKTIALVEKPRREGDPASLVADNSKAKNELGWSPQNSLEKSIKTAYSWEKILNEKVVSV
jgi:UDP-glucose 4-epimerase